MARRTTILAALADVVAVVVFVALGRVNHDEGTSLSSITGVAAPFLLGLGTGWLVVRAWRAPLALTTGLAVAVVTVTAGMLLRRFAWDRGTATAFVIVTAIFVGALLIGWRAVATTVADRRQRAAA